MGILKRGQRAAAKKKKRQAERKQRKTEMRVLLGAALDGDKRARDELLALVKKSHSKRESRLIEKEVLAATSTPAKDEAREAMLKRIDERNRGVGILQDAHVPGSHIRRIDKGRRRK